MSWGTAGLRTMCNGFLYNTTSEDEYYFAYYTGSASTESTITFYVDQQFRYSTANLASQPSCSADVNVLYTRTIPVPYGHYNQALIVTVLGGVVTPENGHTLLCYWSPSFLQYL